MNNLTDVTQRQILRGLILQICNVTAAVGAGTQLILSALRREGYVVTQQDVTDACRYLEGKELITIKNIRNDVLHIDKTIAYITPQGVDVLEGTTMVDGVELT